MGGGVGLAGGIFLAGDWVVEVDPRSLLSSSLVLPVASGDAALWGAACWLPGLGADWSLTSSGVSSSSPGVVLAGTGVPRVEVLVVGNNSGRWCSHPAPLMQWRLAQPGELP